MQLGDGRRLSADLGFGGSLVRFGTEWRHFRCDFRDDDAQLPRAHSLCGIGQVCWEDVGDLAHCEPKLRFGRVREDYDLGLLVERVTAAFGLVSVANASLAPHTFGSTNRTT